MLIVNPAKLLRRFESAKEAVRKAFGKYPDDLSENDLRSAFDKVESRENGSLEFKCLPKEENIHDPRNIEEHIVAPIVAFLNKPFSKSGALILGISEKRGSKTVDGVPSALIPLTIAHEDLAKLLKGIPALIGNHPNYERAYEQHFLLLSRIIPVVGGHAAVILCETELHSVFYSKLSDRAFVRNWNNSTQLTSIEIEQLIKARAKPFLTLCDLQLKTKAHPEKANWIDCELPIVLSNVGGQVARNVSLMLSLQKVDGEMETQYTSGLQDITRLNPGATASYQARADVLHPTGGNTVIGSLFFECSVEAKVFLSVTLTCDDGTFQEAELLTFSRSGNTVAATTREAQMF